MRTFAAYTRKARDVLYGVKPFECPQHLRANHKLLSGEGEQQLTESLKQNYFTYSTYFPDYVESYLSTEHGQVDLKDHLLHRLTRNRKKVIPWIDSVVRIAGKRVLEIGCGTGSSTVALVEQGAEVLASDVHEGSLRVAEDRLQTYELKAQLMCLNATETFKQLDGRSFDMVVFFAVLEHMTLEERLESLQSAWAMLPSGGLLVVHETPNRLWYFDDHTALEHFFLWLPDDLAIRYARRTSREEYRALFTNVDYRNPSTRLDFARWGRGVSYHDFVLAIDIQPAELPVVSCLELFLREKTKTSHLHRNTTERQYEELLHSMSPEVHRGFYLKYLDVILRKP